MAKVTYKNTSPWFETVQNDEYLEYFNIRPIPGHADDILYTIGPQYHLRPDLLAFDLYGTAKLWWVFAQRNFNTIEDPVFDFKAGVQIYLPKKTPLLKSLGM